MQGVGWFMNISYIQLGLCSFISKRYEQDALETLLHFITSNALQGR